MRVGECEGECEGEGEGEGEGEVEGEGAGEGEGEDKVCLGGGGSLTHHFVFAKWAIRSTCPTSYQVSKPLKRSFTKLMR